jgi:hypothetical protein
VDEIRDGIRVGVRVRVGVGAGQVRVSIKG